MTKFILYTMTGFFTFSAMGFDQTAVEVFQQGNRLYQEGKFEEARDAYESIVNNGYVSGELYYNLGNVYYRLGDVARAILNYERASRLISGDEDLRHNLDMANFLLADRIEPAPRLFIWEYWDGLKGGLSLDGATWLVYVIYLLMVTLSATAIMVRSYRLKRLSLIAAVCCVPLMIVATGLFAGKLTDQTRDDMAVVMAEVSNVKNSPDQSSSDAFVLHKGAKVQIMDRITTWIKIRLADGKVGWMNASGVEII
jgi:hypothetical protein